MNDLSTKEKTVFEYVKKCLNDGLSPTVREIANECEIRSIYGVRHIISTLMKKNYLKRKSKRARGLSLTKE